MELARLSAISSMRSLLPRLPLSAGWKRHGFHHPLQPDDLSGMSLRMDRRYDCLSFCLARHLVLEISAIRLEGS